MPDLREHVLDRSSLLPPETQRALEQQLTEFERTSGHQVVVHVTPSLEGLEIEDYSIQIADAWKVGQKNLDNGVILTVAPNERKVRIEVGYGLEGVLPDALAGRIVRDVIVPEFQAGRMDQGVVAGTRAIVAVVAGEKLPVPQRVARPQASPWLVLLWIVLVLVILLARGLFFTPPFGSGGMQRTGRYGGGGLGRSGGFGGGFGRGGGGGGFGGGGGGFGGGGASGSW